LLKSLPDVFKNKGLFRDANFTNFVKYYRDNNDGLYYEDIPSDYLFALPESNNVKRKLVKKRLRTVTHNAQASEGFIGASDAQLLYDNCDPVDKE
jgi:hypothetical protein